jgi:hypothetical protein
MPELQIKKSSTIADFEKHLTISDLGSYTLLVPNSLSGGGALGCSLAYAQFLLSWARASPDRRIRTFLQQADEMAYERFVERIDGFAAAYFADSLSPADGANGNLRNSLLRAARARIVAMHTADLKSLTRESDLQATSRSGKEIEFVFVEGARHEFHGALYSKAPNSGELADPEKHGSVVRTKGDLNRFLEGCFKVLQVHGILEPYLDSEDQPFGSLLAESFRNTAEHGYVQSDGSRLDRNMRCVRIARSQTSRDRIKNFDIGSAESSGAAEKYFRQLAVKEGRHQRTNIDLLELSVFDSGQGLSRTMNASLKSAELTDAELVIKCFEKHQSSKSNEKSGAGFSRMLSAVHSLGGFLRLRTGTTEAFFASTTDYHPEMNPAEYVQGGMAHAEGTLITVGIPLAY